MGKTLDELNVLFADDESAVTFLISNVLSPKINNLHIAEDGLMALELFKAHRDIDIIITDLSMPKMEGEELVSEIRRIDKNIPIVIMSAYEEEECSLGATYSKYLTKPVSPAKITQILMEIFDEQIH